MISTLNGGKVVVDDSTDWRRELVGLLSFIGLLPVGFGLVALGVWLNLQEILSGFLLFFIPAVIMFLGSIWLSKRLTVRNAVVLAVSGVLVSVLGFGAFMLWFFNW